MRMWIRVCVFQNVCVSTRQFDARSLCECIYVCEWTRACPLVCVRVSTGSFFGLETGSLLKLFAFIVSYPICLATSACGNLGLSPALNFVYMGNSELLLLLLSNNHTRAECSTVIAFGMWCQQMINCYYSESSTSCVDIRDCMQHFRCGNIICRMHVHVQLCMFAFRVN